MNAVKKETTQFIEVPLPDEFTAYGDVTMGLNEMDTPGSLNVDYTTGTVKLKKSGVIVEVSIWFDMVSRRKDVIGDINKLIPISWEKKYNEEIASTLFTPMANVRSTHRSIRCISSFRPNTLQYLNEYSKQMQLTLEMLAEPLTEWQ